jgi:hypothetical protein
MDGARCFGGAVGDPEQAARAANEASVQEERSFQDTWGSGGASRATT